MGRRAIGLGPFGIRLLWRQRHRPGLGGCRHCRLGAQTNALALQPLLVVEKPTGAEPGKQHGS